MKKLPKISIIIPTKNSEKTLRLCLKSIKLQDYTQELIETIIVDSYSCDQTLDIARKYNCKIIRTHAKPLGARYLGYLKSQGDILVFIDADHIMARHNLLSDIAYYITNKGYDVLHLEERSFKPRTPIQKLIAADRYTNQQISKLMPLDYGTLYSRVYRREIIEKVFHNIPLNIMLRIHEHEDVIMHYETIKLTRKHITLPKALFHMDEEDLKKFLRKISRYGCMESQTKAILKKYANAIKLKKTFRIREIPYLFLKYPRYALGVLMLLTLKFAAYEYGKIKCTK